MSKLSPIPFRFSFGHFFALLPNNSPYTRHGTVRTVRSQPDYIYIKLSASRSFIIDYLFPLVYVKDI